MCIRSSSAIRYSLGTLNYLVKTIENIYQANTIPAKIEGELTQPISV